MNLSNELLTFSYLARDMNRFLILAFFSFMTASACTQAQVTEVDFHDMLDGMYQNTVPLIKVDEVGSPTTYLFLDTREPEEFKVSHIPGARLTGYDHFDPSMLADIPKNQPIIVYCSVGYRSERIGEKLQKLGFTQVRNLYGGIFDWMSSGQSVVNETNQATEDVHTYNRMWSKWAFTGNKVW